MNNKSDLAEKFVKIFSIPVEEEWKEYLQNDHMNYFAYMVGMGIAGDSSFAYEDFSKYTFQKNHGLNTYINKYSAYYNCDNMQGKIVADVGCGWGFLSFLFLLCGAKEVNAVGFPYQITFMERLKKAAQQRNLLPSESHLRCIEKPLEKGNTDIGGLGANYADQIVFVDVFEHIPNNIFDDAIRASYNTLKPGGELIGSCHNTDNSKVISRIMDYWNRLESGGFKEHRKQLIKQKVTHISPDDLDKLALLTRGMMMEEFEIALKNYQSDKSFPQQSGTPRPAVDLTYDYICENYISPPAVVKSMTKAGFKAMCYPGIRHSRRNMPLWPVEKMFSKVLMKSEALTTSVVFVGKKQL